MIFKEIIKLYKQGYQCIVGLDEAGRGPLAGPVVACAVSIQGSLASRGKLSFQKSFQKIRDSKKLSAKQREKWYEILTAHPDLEWEIGIVSEKIIDEINILEATKLAMVKAVRNLEKKLGKPADFLIIDGNFSIRMAQNYFENRSRRNTTRAVLCEVVQKAVVKADATIFNCIAAGIIAKVTRDKIMMKLHKKYPLYGFDKHKGYGTKQHIEAIGKFGACKIHRKSFKPVRHFLNDQKVAQKVAARR